MTNSNDLHPELLPVVKSDEFLPSIGLWTSLGGWFLVGTCGVAIALATFIKYNIVVKAPGTVRPTGETRVVQATASGTIKRIFVQENQIVKKGDAIAKVDDSKLQTQQKQINDNVEQEEREIGQINAQIGEIDAQIAAESQLIERTIAADEAELRRNQREYQDRQVTTQADVEEAEAAVELAQKELTRFQQLADTGAVPQLQIEQKKEAYKAARARLERAKAGLNPSADNVTIATENIAQERAKGESALATLNKEEETLVQQEIELQKQINHDRQELTQLGSDVQKSLIRAPESGTILQLNLRNLNQVVSAGDAIATISPGNAPLIIKVRIPVAEISKIKVCQEKNISNCSEGKTQLRISAYPYPDYGILNGAVRAISADAITPESNNTSATTPYFEVTIEPERSHLVRGDRNYPIQAGMEVEADIISKEETLLTFILRKARLLTNW
jgi:HlyD family type I secretion membrane fusion protein